MSARKTHTYATLVIAPSAYAEVRLRLEQSGTLSDYVQDECEITEVLVLGTVALAPDFRHQEPFIWMRRNVS